MARAASANARGRERHGACREETHSKQEQDTKRASAERARERSERWTEARSTAQKHVNCIPRAVAGSLGFFFFVRNDTI